MPLSVSQIMAVSFNAVVNEARGAANQWAESSLLREFEKQGFVKRVNLGAQIEATLDYQRNPGAGFLAYDLAPVSMSKTDVLTAAVYDIAEITSPIVWSKKDEAMNPTENQKIDLVKALITNGLDSHDDLIEQYTFATSTNGYLGLLTHVPTNGQGTDGGIDSATYTFWRNQQATYVDDTDIEAAFTTVRNAVAKGSGSKLQATLMVSDAATHAIFEGTQQALQRYDSQDAKAGFKSIMFGNAKYIFSQYGTSSVYFLNPKNLQLVCSKQFFRERGDTQELQNANGYVLKLYSALQLITNNKSRLGVAHV